jgi:hypothetical protein
MAAEPVPALPTRFRFASGSAPSARTQGEIEEQLRKRLRFVITIFIGGFLLEFFGGGLRLSSGDAGDSRQVLQFIVVTSAMWLPFLFWARWHLAPTRTHTLRALRRLEIAVTALFVLQAILANVVDFPTIVPILSVAPIDLGAGFAGPISWCIVAYGVLIPNTWRRCSSVVIGIAVVSTIAVVWMLVGVDAPDSAKASFLGARMLVLFPSTAIAIYGSYRIELSESVARAATQLGQYLLRDRLGSGGMGEVYRAEHQLLRRPCAVKLIRAEHAGNAEVLQRFEREVQATAALTHPNTVAIYDYGISEDGTFYYVMEYLPGQTLEEIVTKEGPMAPARAVHVLRQVAGALQEAHTAGLTHRDIKPGNVMVCERGGVPDVAKLLDFGLVVTSGIQQADSKLTQAGIILGTPAYMSPEQCAGEEQPGPLSDIYSMGALAYFMLTGRSPFEGKAPVQMLMAHLGEMPASVRSLRPEVPAALDAVVMRCLTKRPEERIGSAGKLGEALAAVLERV